MARKRFQKGSLSLKGNQWVARWREDELDQSCTLRRVRRAVVLGTREEFPTKRLALRALQERLDAVNNPTAKATSNVPFEVFIDKWVETVLPTYKVSTRAAMKCAASHFRKVLGKLPVKEISTEVLQRYISTQKDCAPKSVRNRLALLRIVWSVAKAWKYVNHDPFAGLVKPKGKRAKPIRYFTSDEMRMILTNAPENWKLFFRLCAEAGMRIGEVQGLQAGDVDFKRQQVTIYRGVFRGQVIETKTESGLRTFHISDGLAAMLKERCEGLRPDEFIYHTRTGRPYNYGNILASVLHPLLKKLGLEPRGFHAFRHGNGTMMDQINAPLKTRQERLGHADAEVTLGIYTHANGQDDQQVAQEIGKILDSPWTPIEESVA